MLVFHVTFKCRPETREEFWEAILTGGIDAACRGEAGNIAYDYYFPAENPDELLLIEKWKDAAALAQHARQPHMARMDEIKAEYVTDMRIEMYGDVQPGRADAAAFCKSVLEADREAVVLCDLEHRIVYMNPAAKEKYGKYGGGALVGKSLLDCHNERSRELIVKITDRFKASRENDLVHTFYNQRENKDVYMAALRGEDGGLIGYYEKHERRDRDTAELYKPE